jgi:glycosyltransferase involved in cell wall biosynthesis
MKTKIRVLFLQSPGDFGSDSMIHGLLMRYFDREHMEVHVACTVGSGHEKPASLKVVETIPDLHLRLTNFGPTVRMRSKPAIVWSTISTGLPALASITGLIPYIKHHNIDIIHGNWKPRDAFYGVSVARLAGVKSIIHLHVKCADWMNPLSLWAMKQADGIIGVSQFVAQSAIEMGYAPGKTYHVLNSLDTSRPDYAADGSAVRQWDHITDGSAIRREFDIAPDVPLLAIVSRLFPWKGHAELLKALVEVKAKVPDIKLLVVGGDDPGATPGGGSYTAVVQALARELGLTEQVIFTGSRPDVPQIMAACDLFTMPSFEEPFGEVFLEAMAMKKPIIALDNGGTSEVVEHGKSGLLSPPQDISRLAENILLLINNPVLRQQMGEYGRMRVEQYFNPQRMADDIEHVYRLVLGESRDNVTATSAQSQATSI